MTVDEIKKEILECAKIWNEIEEEKIDDFSWVEEDVETLILEYCESHNYIINGFPTEKRKMLEEDEEFSREEIILYIELLAIEKDDVAELWWFYYKSFWGDSETTKEDFLKEVKERVENGFYSVVI